MIDISDIKDEFQNSLKSIFSDVECMSIWNQWVVKEMLNMSLIDYFLKLPKKMKYFIGFLFCCALMTYALYAQYVLNLEPCPLCIFQRIAVIVMGIIFLFCSITYTV